LATNPERRTALAAELQAFALEKWNPKSMAGRFLPLLTGDTLSHWRIDPADLRYWQGWGAPEDVVRSAAASMIALAGAKSLGLIHNPRLQAEIIRQTTLETSEITE
jgi:hypothetical protein